MHKQQAKYQQFFTYENDKELYEIFLQSTYVVYKLLTWRIIAQQESFQAHCFPETI